MRSMKINLVHEVKQQLENLKIDSDLRALIDAELADYAFLEEFPKDLNEA